MLAFGRFNDPDQEALDLKEQTQMHIEPPRMIARVQHVIHEYYVWITIASYIAAVFFPELGQAVRGAHIGSSAPDGAALPLPLAMLGFLLFNAGLGVRTSELRRLTQRPLPILAALLANMSAPLIYMLAVGFAMRLWPDPDEVQQILTGLALISSLPVAAASSAWTQNANGNLTLSLGLILLTTLASPLLTPLVLHAAAGLTTGVYSQALVQLAKNDAGAFLGAWIILPSVLGMSAHWALGEKRTALISAYLKLANSIVLVLLNYSYASTTLPGIFAQPNLAFVLAMLATVALLCVGMFAVGFLVAAAFRLDRAGTASLTFGLGMNNNIAGLALASVAFSNSPGVLTPIILYNLSQHLVASFVDKLLARAQFGASPSRLALVSHALGKQGPS